MAVTKILVPHVNDVKCLMSKVRVVVKYQSNGSVLQ